MYAQFFTPTLNREVEPIFRGGLPQSGGTTGAGAQGWKYFFSQLAQTETAEGNCLGMGGVLSSKASRQVSLPPASGLAEQMCMAEVDEIDEEMPAVESKSWRDANYLAPEDQASSQRGSPFAPAPQQKTYTLLAPSDLPALQDRAAKLPQRMVGHARGSRPKPSFGRLASPELLLEPVSPVHASPPRATTTLCKHGSSGRSARSPKDRPPAVIRCEEEPASWNLENFSPQGSPERKCGHSQHALAFGHAGRQNLQDTSPTFWLPGSGLPRKSTFYSKRAPKDTGNMVNSILPFIRSP
jgi:hypothetical protein